MSDKMTGRQFRRMFLRVLPLSLVSAIVFITLAKFLGMSGGAGAAAAGAVTGVLATRLNDNRAS
ncbi:hypothetical protein [Singulisphaera sp. PoT]|uniref:hypothetical protein n=1 Tax=Singulisphaera sp. PoT TaxID=3411797 RepID=UPI003BF5610B